MSRIEAARAILAANDRGGYTVPTDRLYPFQWNWDSAFVAMGWATFDAERAWREIERLLEGQWEGGLVPQIVFHAPSDDYFPGPDVWGVTHKPPTSGIPQPPVLATAVRFVLERHGAAGVERARAIYPRLILNHLWWQHARDPEATGLVATLHPWETGMDNSPAWDAALERVPTETKTEIRRRDTGHIDPAFRPRGIEYQRFIHLVDLFRETGWNARRMLETSPFKVADVGTNAILLRAERDLLALAEQFGNADEREMITARIARKEIVLAGLWDGTLGHYLSRDLIGGNLIPVRTSAGFLPVFAGLHEHVRVLAGRLEGWRARGIALVPSTDPEAASFEPQRYWRGPVWAVVNWMIARGLREAGEGAAAASVAEETRRLIGEAGFSEYFNPIDRAGIGGETFSWTAAIDLLLGEGEGR
ncbi:trehalase family glycosidase [uncultured Bosea sp.]|uniref:MGH1-like glycoside hydrolase domain-containing protein n=1 Tax=uncultured Bosea sp. TaxID=211457 RepID=UPI0025F86CF9|nr:trehalase family glycosidase [uncultured Bosea sp.]